MHSLYSNSNFSETMKGYQRNFSARWDKEKFQQKIVISPSYAQKFSITENFWNFEWIPHEIFDTVREIKFQQKKWYSLLIYKVFRHLSFSESMKGSPRKFSALWEKSFNRKLWYPTFRSRNFRYASFSETLKGTPQNFSALRDKKLSTKSWYAYYPKKIQHQNVAELQGPPYEVFRSSENKMFDKTMILCIKWFDARIFLKHWLVSPTKFFGTVRKKKFQQQIVIAPSYV